MTAVAGSASITSELKHWSTRPAGLSLGSAHLHSDGFAFCQGLPAPSAFWGFISRTQPPHLPALHTPELASRDFFFTRVVSNCGRGCLPLISLFTEPSGQGRKWLAISLGSRSSLPQEYHHVAPRAFQVELMYEKSGPYGNVNAHVRCYMWSQLLHNHVFTKRGERPWDKRNPDHRCLIIALSLQGLQEV